MLKYTTYYTLLSVSPQATEKEIKSAFRKLALIHHPDKNANSPRSHTIFILISRASATLLDPEKRKIYDSYLRHSTSLRNRKNHAPSPLLPGREGESYRPAAELLNSFNFLLWDIEDLLQNPLSPGGEQEKLIIKILVFIDKWVLSPAGYPDYFRKARKMEGCDLIQELAYLIHPGNYSGYKPYTGLRDYFYALRRRMDRFLDKCRPQDLEQRVSGSPFRLIDCVVEAQNHALHYLGFLLNKTTTETGPVPDFPFSDHKFAS